MKKCNACLEYKKLEEFQKRIYKNKNIGKNVCKLCASKLDYRKQLVGEKRIKYLRKHADYQKIWRGTHPDYVLENFGYGKYRFTRSKAQAKRSKCEWTIDKNDYHMLLTKQCFYCDGNLEEKGIALDKIDPTKKIYSIDNVVPCCKRCNWIKGTWFTLDEMVKIGNVIKSFKLEKGV